MPSGCLPICEDKKVVGWVCTGGSKAYVARVRWHGYRNYQILIRTRSYRKAARTLADAMVKRGGMRYKRGDVLMEQPYYDPMILLEMVNA